MDIDINKYKDGANGLLKSKGMMVDSHCVMCQNGEESINHLFLTCGVAIELWDSVLSPMRQRAPRPI
ncbi:hypothetical protein FRX31_007729 [Thalictrum thalictroides]|uniref:Reverse transcriptase zinc-binding domain-containing protein n=1 Tax=Thalictrum thalictroides TaxID=46969 RepID=A0A7J6X2X6_THATH|nr:hypothetical protein FRX31_007729 [Thalictrum thalictroides]